MAKKIRFPLEMADGVHVRTLAELKEHFDAEHVVGYYLDGKLKTWLDDRYIEKEAAAVDGLSRDDEELAQKLCEIFGVEYLGDLDPEEIAYRNKRIARLKQLTDDPEIIKQVDIVAFDQDDLFDRYDEGRTKIILAEGEFDIPESKRDVEYVRLGEQSQTADHETDGKQASQDAVGGGFEYIIKVTNYDSYISGEFIINLLIFLSKENVLDNATANLLSVLVINQYISDKYYDMAKVLSGRLKYTSYDEAEKVRMLIISYSKQYYFENSFDTKSVVNPHKEIPHWSIVHIWTRRIETPTGSCSLYISAKIYNLIMNRGKDAGKDARKAIHDIPNLCNEFSKSSYNNEEDLLALRRNDISKDGIQDIFDKIFKPLLAGCRLNEIETNVFCIT